MAVTSANGAAVALSPNYIINGDFAISQRGSSITSINSDWTYTADRFYCSRGGSVDYAQRQTGSYTPPIGFEYYGEYVNKSAGNPFAIIGQMIETKNAIQLAGKTVTLSFYARAHADTTASKTLNTYILSTDSVDSRASRVAVATVTSTMAYGTGLSAWQRFSVSAIIPNTAKTVSFEIGLGTSTINDGFHITGIQLEVGSVATPFRRNSPNLQAELAACQRYYYQYGSKTDGNTLLARTQHYSTGAATVYHTIVHPVPMRINPALDVYFDTNDGAPYQATTIVSSSVKQGWAAVPNIAAGAFVDVDYISANAEL